MFASRRKTSVKITTVATGCSKTQITPRLAWRSLAPARSPARYAEALSDSRLRESGFTYGFTPHDAGDAASELTLDNFGAGYLAGLGEGYTELGLLAPPVTKEGAKDLYLKPSMLHSISAKTAMASLPLRCKFRMPPSCDICWT